MHWWVAWVASAFVMRFGFWPYPKGRRSRPLFAITQARNTSAFIAACAPRGCRDPCWVAWIGRSILLFRVDLGLSGLRASFVLRDYGHSKGQLRAGVSVAIARDARRARAVRVARNSCSRCASVSRVMPISAAILRISSSVGLSSDITFSSKAKGESRKAIGGSTGGSVTPAAREYLAAAPTLLTYNLLWIFTGRNMPRRPLSANAWGVLAQDLAGCFAAGIAETAGFFGGAFFLRTMGLGGGPF